MVGAPTSEVSDMISGQVERSNKGFNERKGALDRTKKGLSNKGTRVLGVLG